MVPGGSWRPCVSVVAACLIVAVYAVEARLANACDAAPRNDCLAPRMSRIRIEDRRDDAGDRIDWAWKRGAGFSGATVGDPTLATSLDLCVYDYSAGVPALATTLVVAPSPIWRTTPKGWLYLDSAAAGDGVWQLRIDAGESGRSAVRLLARGTAVPLPAPAGAARYFAAEPGLRVQLIASSAGTAIGCWESSFPAALVRRNEPSGFKALAASADPLPKRVFVTSGCYDGALGGLGGADAACQALADAAALGGQYKAWLSDGVDGPATRFQRAAVPYVLLDGRRVADHWSDLTDGSLAAAIDLDEAARAVDPTSACPQVVWTNTSADGYPAIGDSYEFVCQSWTISLFARSALTGSAGAVDGAWTDGAEFAMRRCNLPARLYCFEQ